MLGFWIIITHLLGAYVTSSEYMQNRAVNSTAFALGVAILYMIPFVLFLPGSIPSFAIVFVFRFLVVRFGLIDYIIWARNLMAPSNQRSKRIVIDGAVNMKDATTNQKVSMHAASIAMHGLVTALAIIVL